MQLSSIENITEDNIVFHTAKKHKVPNSKIKYQRKKIERKLPNGKFSPLVVETPFLFSFGISERKDEETKKISGYSIPICLWKKDAEPNKKELNFFNIVNKVHDLCRVHLAKEYGENEAASLSEKLYYKQIEYIDGKGKTKKKKDKSSAPVLYVKLIYSSFSIQVKAHEVHILPFEERKSILKYKENDEEDEAEVESEQEDNHYEDDEELEE